MAEKTLSHYELTEKLGQGGMATVYQAVDLTSRKLVAIKILYPEFASDEVVRTRFLREGRAGMELEHPGIVKVYEVGEEGGQLFITMELVHGKTLEELSQEEVLDVGRIVDIGIKVADALSAAHRKKIIHRDIKPRNIMVSNGDTKVMDFGLVRVLDAPTVTEKHEVVGTLHYMSPQQAIGVEIDERSDVFSLGVVLYQLLTGVLPFEGEHPGAIIHSILHSDPLRIDELRHGIPCEVEQVVFKALQKNLQDRYQSAEELKSDLESAKRSLEGEPVKLIATEEVFEEPARGIYSSLVGREKELELLDGYLRRMLKGEGSTVLVKGEAGIGKSRLVWELGRRAKKARARYLVGRCFFGTEGFPYQPVLEVIRSHLEVKGVKDTKRLHNFIHDKAPHLAQRTGAIQTLLSVGEKTRSLPISREQIWDTVTELVKVISQDRPALIHIDDLHWGDVDTLHLIAYLARNIRRERILIVGTFRPEELTEEPERHPLLPLLERMSESGLSHEIQLERLDEGGTEAVIRSVFPDTDLSRSLVHLVYGETEGNPLFILEVLQLLRKEGLIDRRNGGKRLTSEVAEAAIPKKVSEVIMSRLRKLNREERLLVDVASVEGRLFHSEVLSFCLDFPRLKVLLGLRDLEQSHHLIHASEKEYRFDHVKIREVVYDGLMPELRREYHKRVGQYLESNYGEEEEYSAKIAHHLMEADEREHALPYLVEAGEHARKLFATGDALWYFDKGLELAADLLNKGRTGDLLRANATLLRGRADVNRLFGRYGDARDDYEQLQKLARELDDGKELAYGVYGVGITFACEGDYERALSHQQEAVEIQRRIGDEPGLGDTLNNIGNVHYYSGEYEKALDHYSQALTIQAQIGNRLGEGNALNNMGNVHYDQGDYVMALRHFEQSLEIKREIGDKLGEANTLNNIGNVHKDRGECEKALDHYSRALMIQSEIGNRLGEGDAFTNIAEVHHGLGNYGVALEYYEKGLSTHRQIGRREGEWESEHRLYHLWLDVGDQKRAVEKLREAERIAEEIGSKQRIVWSHIDSGLAKLAEGSFSQALACIGEALDSAQKMKEVGAIVQALMIAARAAQATGDPDRAIQLAGEAAGLASERGRRPDVAKTRFLLACIHLSRRDFDKAEADVDKALEAASICGAAPYKWQAHHCRGRISLERNDRVSALEELRKAEQIVDTISSKLDEKLREMYSSKEEVRQLYADLKKVRGDLNSGRKS